MKLAYKVGTGLASALVVASAFAPAIFADTTINISGNGAGSTNKIILNSSCTVGVSQINSTTVGVNADVSANTGGNTASKNTGGDVTIQTGDATSSTSVVVAGSTNEATVPDCACICQTGLDVNVTGNGAGTTNKVKKTTTTVQSVSQTNALTVGVNAKVKAKTGKNKSNKNTGGTTGITTGDSTSGVGVSVTAPSNTL